MLKNKDFTTSCNWNKNWQTQYTVLNTHDKTAWNLFCLLFSKSVDWTSIFSDPPNHFFLSLRDRPNYFFDVSTYDISQAGVILAVKNNHQVVNTYIIVPCATWNITSVLRRFAECSRDQLMESPQGPSFASTFQSSSSLDVHGVEIV